MSRGYEDLVERLIELEERFENLEDCVQRILDELEQAAVTQELPRYTSELETQEFRNYESEEYEDQ